MTWIDILNLFGVGLCAYFCGVWRRLDAYEAEIDEQKRSALFWRELYEKAKGGNE